MLSGLTGADAGVYTCVAENSLGTAESRGRLTILRKYPCGCGWVGGHQCCLGTVESCGLWIILCEYPCVCGGGGGAELRGEVRMGGPVFLRTTWDS